MKYAKIVLLAAALTACGGGGTSGDLHNTGGPASAGSAGDTTTSAANGGGASGGAATTGGANGGGANGGAGATGGTDVSNAPPPYYGQVQFGWIWTTSQYTVANATFSNPSTASGPVCTKEVIGACTVSTCSTATAAGIAPQAGKLTLSDGMNFNVTLTPDANGKYAGYSAPGVLLPGAETVTVTAAGGEVPAFSATAQQPLVLLLTSPAAPQGAIAWPPSQDLTLKFDRGVPGLRLLVQGGAAPAPAIHCDFPSESGSATIPSAVLSKVGTGTVLDVFSYTASRLQSGPYSIDLFAFGEVTNATKTAGVYLAIK